MQTIVHVLAAIFSQALQLFSENWHTKIAGLNALNHVGMKILSGSALHRR